MTHEEQHLGQPMTIVECDPPRRLVVEWPQEGTGGWRVDLDLSARDGRTVLRFVQVFPADADVADVAMGWHWYLDKFDTEVSGRPGPGEWDTFFPQVAPDYGRG